MASIVFLAGRTLLAFVLLYGGMLAITQDMEYNYKNVARLFSSARPGLDVFVKGDFTYYFVIAEGTLLVLGATLLGLGQNVGCYLLMLAGTGFMATSHNPALVSSEEEKMARLSYIMKDLTVFGACFLQISFSRQQEEY